MKRASHKSSLAGGRLTASGDRKLTADAQTAGAKVSYDPLRTSDSKGYIGLPKPRGRGRAPL